MTSSTDTVRSDPFPSLIDLLSPGGGGRGAADEARLHAEREGYQDGFEAGRADGYDAGFAAGREAVTARADELIRSVRSSVDAAVAAQASAAEGLAATVVDVALQIAAAVVTREVEVARSPGRDALVRALTEAPPAGRLVARLHPADVELLDVEDLPATPDRPIDIVADPAVEVGGCLLETPTGRIDALLSSALTRVTQALRPTHDEVEA